MITCDLHIKLLKKLFYETTCSLPISAIINPHSVL